MYLYIKRIASDVSQLEKHFDTYKHIEINSEITIYVFDEMDRYVKIKLNTYYPMKPPILYIVKNSKEYNYIYLYKNLSKFYIKNLSLKNDNIILYNNIIHQWKPINRLIDVVREYKKIEIWFNTIRSLYYGIKVLNKKQQISDDVIKLICSYIYLDV